MVLGQFHSLPEAMMGFLSRVEKPELEEQPECREEKRGCLHVWKSELVEAEDDVYLRHSSSLTHGP
nr:minor histocompatibility protein HB-1 [Chlorocebus sabaeus]